MTTPVLSASTVNQGVTVSVAATATDPSGVVSTEVRVDSGAWLSMSPAAGNGVSTPRNGSALVNFGVEAPTLAENEVTVSADGVSNMVQAMARLQTDRREMER